MENVHRGFCNVLCFFAVLRFGYCFAFPLDSTIDFCAARPIPWYDWASMRSLKGGGTAALRTLWYSDTVNVHQVGLSKNSFAWKSENRIPQNLLIIHFPCQNCQPCYRFGLISTLAGGVRSHLANRHHCLQRPWIPILKEHWGFHDIPSFYCNWYTIIMSWFLDSIIYN